jgi:hypothetical protein
MNTILSWYHKRANISTIQAQQITKEFQEALPIVYPEFKLENNYLTKGTFHDKIDNDLLRELIPTLSVVLKDMGIYHLWEKTALVAATPNQPVTIHRDGTPNFKRLIALNFPIHNCEDSVTSFYEVKEGVERIEELVPNKGTPYTKLILNKDDLVKVDSVIVDQPTWLRVNALHEVLTNKNRIAASVRFKPEPVDYLNSL